MLFDFSKLKILVVEDTFSMLKLITSVLKALGVTMIYTAKDGEEGFKTFIQERPDIVVADWHMAPMDGITLTKMIRTDPLSPHKMVPIILVTGYSALDRVAAARDAGVTDFLVKPFSASDLAKRITYTIKYPRDFIDAPRYFGPDRRRKRDDNPEITPRRRYTDMKEQNTHRTPNGIKH